MDVSLWLSLWRRGRGVIFSVESSGGWQGAPRRVHARPHHPPRASGETARKIGGHPNRPAARPFTSISTVFILLPSDTSASIL
ncbi:hypothetical protein PsYK624_010550 [Phanerochaete sordida]|uniref:Uncharacterized protein n=1 Tax=Phanerochaete sordida TaxID=48140 RepID=A0A9P3FXI9_9APHY|nr:hypothetical protein PsYK624_010550 [Phanerochaete sordida]